MSMSKDVKIKTAGGKKITLITHPRPHIDDLCGMWLLARFWPPAKKADFEFISSTTADPGDPRRVWVGVGRGRFDEHKGDIGESAATLVFKFLKTERPDIDAAEMAALEKLVFWVRNEDLALHSDDPYRDFSIPTILRSHYDLHRRDSRELAEFGFKLLDDLYETLQNQVRLERDWQNRYEFEGPWGPAVAIETSAYGADDYAYNHGFKLLVLLDPVRGNRAFRAAANSQVDLTEAYETLKRADPKVSWFLHHSRKLLLSGSDVAPEVRRSKLSLKDLLHVIQPMKNRG